MVDAANVANSIQVALGSRAGSWLYGQERVESFLLLGLLRELVVEHEMLGWLLRRDDDLGESRWEVLSFEFVGASEFRVGYDLKLIALASS